MGTGSVGNGASHVRRTVSPADARVAVRMRVIKIWSSDFIYFTTVVPVAPTRVWFAPVILVLYRVLWM